jgi:protein-disulfide isomerase
MHNRAVGCRIRGVTFRTIAALVLSSVVFNGCSSSGPPSSKSAVDVSDLSTRERATFERLVDEMLAPCASEAVTLDVCLNEKRNCKACKPAANFLAERVKAGFDKPTIRKSYEKRFGGEVKQIDLADSPTLGPATAVVTIVAWSDFQCPHCKHVIPLLERLVESHAGDVRLVHKFYPIAHHTYAKIAARAAYAAQRQGKYWEMEKLIFDNQNKLGEQSILDFAASLGLDMDRVKSDMDSEAATQVLTRDKAEAERLGLDGTPFVLINGREFDFRLFQAEPDLDSWVTMEIALAKGQ